MKKVQFLFAPLWIATKAGWQGVPSSCKKGVRHSVQDMRWQTA